MTREEIGSKLRDIMKDSSQEAVDWDSFSEQSDITSLGFDSLSILDLIYDIQQSFNVEFEAENLADVQTVGDLVSFLEKQLS